MQMNLSPVISIITVSYNAVDTIESTILSVIHQTYENMEYIIIDGGSTDGTVDLIKKYQDKLAYWVSEPDKGIYDAMNKGIDKVTGDWVNFMNSGDTFAGNEIISRIFNRKFNDVGVIYGNVNKIFRNHSQVIKPGPLVNINKHLPFCHQASFSRIDLLRDKFDLKYGLVADDAFFYRLYKLNTRFIYIDEIMANYEASKGVSSRNIKQALWENYLIRGGRRYYYWYLFIFLPIIMKHKLYLLLYK